MLAIDAGFFLRIPTESDQRILHAATIKECRDKVYTAVLDDQVELSAGDDVLVYFEKSREFMQQPARIDAVLESDPKIVIGFRTTGEPVSAESRQCYRVSTIFTNFKAELGEEKDCPLLDVSATGFSVIAATSHSIGTIVPAVLFLDGRSYKGKACVQSRRELEPGRTRYGIYCVDDRSISGDLQKGMQTISMFVQRQQLRRLAGSA